MDNALPRCSGIKASGQRCERIVSAHGELCYSHDPTQAEARKSTASKAGKKSRRGSVNDEIVEVRAKLREVSEAVEAGKLTTAKGSVIAQILGVLLRTFDQERRQKEFDEIRSEMRELRELFEQQKEARRYG